MPSHPGLRSGFEQDELEPPSPPRPPRAISAATNHDDVVRLTEQLADLRGHFFSFRTDFAKRVDDLENQADNTGNHLIDQLRQQVRTFEEKEEAHTLEEKRTQAAVLTAEAARRKGLYEKVALVLFGAAVSFGATRLERCHVTTVDEPAKVDAGK